mgnify:CR=1 FL=1
MNEMYKKLANLHHDWLKEFIAWYKDNYATGIDIKILITLDRNYSIGILHEYLNKKYNLGILYDAYTYYIYIIRPELYANELIDKFKSDGVFTHVLYKHSQNREYKLNTVFEHALFKTLEKLENEF